MKESDVDQSKLSYSAKELYNMRSQSPWGKLIEYITFDDLTSLTTAACEALQQNVTLCKLLLPEDRGGYNIIKFDDYKNIKKSNIYDKLAETRDLAQIPSQARVNILQKLKNTNWENITHLQLIEDHRELFVKVDHMQNAKQPHVVEMENFQKRVEDFTNEQRKKDSGWDWPADMRDINSLNVMFDPVTTYSGHTFDKFDLIDYIQYHSIEASKAKNPLNPNEDMGFNTKTGLPFIWVKEESFQPSWMREPPLPSFSTKDVVPNVPLKELINHILSGNEIATFPGLFKDQENKTYFEEPWLTKDGHTIEQGNPEAVAPNLVLKGVIEEVRRNTVKLR